MSDWEDFDENDVTNQKEGEMNDEIVKQEQPVQKTVQAQKNDDNKQTVTKKEKKEQKNQKKEQAQPKQPLTKDQKRDIQLEIERNQAKELDLFFNQELNQKIGEIILEDEKQLENFAKVVSLKLERVDIKKHVEKFFLELIELQSEQLTLQEFTTIQNKLNVIVNKKIKQDKGKDKKKKKGGVNMSKPKDFGLYDDFKIDNQDEDDEYVDKDADYDFM